MTTENQAPEGGPTERLDKLLWEAIDCAASHPVEAREVDPRTWHHLLTYSTYTPSPAEAHGDERAAFDALLNAMTKIVNGCKDVSALGIDPDELRVVMVKARAALAHPQPKGTAAELTDVQIADAATGIKPYPVELAQVPAAQTVAFARAVIAADRALQAPTPALELTDEQIVAAWDAWPHTAITSRRRAVEFVRSLPAPAPAVAHAQQPDKEREELWKLLMAMAIIREMTKTQQQDADATVKAVRTALSHVQGEEQA